MLLIVLFVYLAIAGLTVFALAVAAASGNEHDVTIERDAEIVERARERRAEVVGHAS